jgi:hypothetical protein
MKKITTVVILTFTFFLGFSQNDSAIFLHHSTGGYVYSEGGVAAWINDYNDGNGTDYYLKQFSYPNTPWPWNNYPYDYWKLWIDGSCDNSQSGIECLESIASKYELVILKHCFPGAGILEPDDNPDVTSSKKTFENYKLQYRALRDKMDDMPNTKFMFWTLAPLHRLSTSPEQAQRANEFVEWVKNDFLTEDEEEHPNIYIFDFFGLVAELSATPENGVQYCLKYEYEDKHDNGDSHPNVDANEYAGPIFARAVVNALADTNQITDVYPDLSTSDKPEICTGSEYNLSDLNIVDANSTGATYSYHTASPAIEANELESPIVSPLISTTYYILGSTETGLTDEIPVEVKVNNIPDLSTVTEPVISFGGNYNLTNIAIVDANNTEAEYTYHSGSPAASNNELESTIVSPDVTTNYYILGNNSGCTDELLVTVTVQQETSIKNNTDKAKKLFEIYPVPVKNTLQLKINPSAVVTSIEIISIDGKTVKKYTRFNGNYNYDVAELQNGMYILKIVINDQPMVKSFIKK